MALQEQGFRPRHGRLQRAGACRSSRSSTSWSARSWRSSARCSWRKFGAGIFVADLVGIAVAREMARDHHRGRHRRAAPAPRSPRSSPPCRPTRRSMRWKCSALAAVDFLVLPRVLALLVMMPLLYVYACVTGMPAAWSSAVAHARHLAPPPTWSARARCSSLAHLGLGRRQVAGLRRAGRRWSAATAGCTRSAAPTASAARPRRPWWPASSASSCSTRSSPSRQRAGDLMGGTALHRGEAADDALRRAR